MATPLVLRPRADRDIDELVGWLRAESPPSAAAFLDQLEAAFERLALFPDSGSTRHATRVPGLPVPLRFLPVSPTRFPRLLIYYLPFETHIDVIRVWDAARGLEALLESAGDPAAG
ncbi:MAG: plasmid stabilization protein [Xanthomonadaceae bacterium]|nr:plasmid stabilization protein [Xanthomonadaceae bacterium]